jgi:hypothetical protein
MSTTSEPTIELDDLHASHQDQAGEPPVDGVAVEQPVVSRSASGNAWLLFVGVMVAASLVREGFHRLGDNPIAVRARGASRGEALFAINLVFRAFYRIGAGVLRPS